jgi:hypothetical protein
MRVTLKMRRVALKVYDVNCQAADGTPNRQLTLFDSRYRVSWVQLARLVKLQG